MIIHFGSTIGAVQKTGQRICLTQRVDALGRLAELLYKLPCFPVHNGLVGILKDQPVLPGILHGVFIFVGLLVRTEIHRMPHILRLGQNLPDDVAAPVIGIGELLFTFPESLVLLAEVDSRRVDLIVKEDTGDVVGAFALNG